MLVILVLSSPSCKALLILSSETALIWSGFYLAYWVIGTGPIMAMLSNAASVERGSGGLSVVPHTVTTV
jgi:hypothetical protein